jgi:hypothetical protein
VQSGEPVFAELLGERGGEDDFALASFGFERCVFTVAAELPVDVDQSGVVVDVGPGEPSASPIRCMRGSRTSVAVSGIAVKRVSSPPSMIETRAVGLSAGRWKPIPPLN